MSKLRVVFSTGSPLTDEDFRYVYAKVKSDVMLASISGGTDICSCFALGNPTLPVLSQRPFPTGSELQVRVTVTPSGDGFATVSINAGARRRAPGFWIGHGRPGLRPRFGAVRRGREGGAGLRDADGAGAGLLLRC